jgi:hypothetical protein
MECIAVIAVSVGLIFAKLADMQELNPIVWGTLALVVYAGLPSYLLWRKVDIDDWPMVWASSFIGLFALFIVQSIVAAMKRRRNR